MKRTGICFSRFFRAFLKEHISMAVICVLLFISLRRLIGGQATVSALTGVLGGV